MGIRNAGLKPQALPSIKYDKQISPKIDKEIVRPKMISLKFICLFIIKRMVWIIASNESSKAPNKKGIMIIPIIILFC